MSTTEVQTQIEEKPETNRMVGQVKWFNNKVGYGFITVKEADKEEKDIFVHYTTINVADSLHQYRYLVQGEYVEFDLTTSSKPPHEYQSSNISGINGGKLMCETRQVNRPVKKEYESNQNPSSVPRNVSSAPRKRNPDTNGNGNGNTSVNVRSKEVRSTPTYKDTVDKEGFQVVRKRKL